jgi:subtilisin family serine protease
MEVLSCMGGNLPGQLIGTAPKAKYWLLRSEDVNSEFIIEEFNWVAAAEFADSAGADIINSSLSYTVFSDPDQDHTCADMDGNTTPATRGANIAESKGMIVVNSAGNLGASITWKCISAPADGYGVLSVAAVDSNGLRAGFSSAGVSTDRIKPNVAAMGKGTVVSSTVGTIMYNNGTSFSSPIIAGMAACLWEAAPGWNSRSIARAIELSGNQASNPDSLLGYGIPDFIKALNQVGIDKKLVPSRLNVFPNPFSDGMTLSFKSKNEQHYDLHLIDNLGQVRYSLRKQQARAGENKISLSGLQAIPPGSYILKVTGEQLFMSHHVVKVIN